MMLLLARNHSAMTHVPTAAAILGAVAALALLFVYKKEVAFCWAVLSITAFVTVIPTMITGIAAAKGRLNDAGKPYIQSGVIVDNVPANARIHLHQIMGISGGMVAAVLALLGIRSLRGGNSNKYLVFLLALLLAILWGIGGHLGGEELWGADTFPAFH
jgi:formate hydrogenlyase subunit 3/multisubunit Na+/H+ antiporter MnhD subunit